MFAIKVLANKKSRSENFEKTILTVKNFLSQKLSQKFKTISDDSSVEIISGNGLEYSEGDIIIEMVVKKSFVVKSSDFEDRAAIDYYLNNIKNFCEQAKAIDEFRYVPFVMKK